MPFASKAQHRKFRAMEAAGELPKGTSHEWAEHTKDMKALPEHKTKESAVARDFAPLNDGGKAEKHPNMPVSTAEVAEGTAAEKEHTTSKTKARAIAVDHVVEIPDYYKRLEKLEDGAKADGVKRAVDEHDDMEARHAQELHEATEAANADLAKNQTSAEIFSAIGALPSAIPGAGLFLPMYPEVRSNAMEAVHAQAQEKADAIGELQRRHAAERAAAGKVADAMMAAPRGDELHLPLTLNPYAGDQKQSSDYENGYSYAQARGHMMLNQATDGDVQRWSGSSPAWRSGFAEACRKLGVGRVGDAVDPSKVGGTGLRFNPGYGESRMNNPSKIAAFTLDTDSDVEGSAIDVLEAKHAAIGATLGTLAGIGGGALLGHYATPAMHWAMSPGEGAAMHDLAQSQVAGPAGDAVDPNATPEARAHAAAQLQEGLQRMQDPNFVHGAQAGTEAARNSTWGGMSELGTVAGAGVGGIAGHQLGRGLDQAFGLEKRERPLVISPMAPRPF